MNPLARIFGPNWRTTLSGVGAAFFGLLSILAVAPYQLGELATFIPPEWKARVLAVSALAAFILRLWNANVSKDAKTVEEQPAAPVPVSIVPTRESPGGPGILPPLDPSAYAPSSTPLRPTSRLPASAVTPLPAPAQPTPPTT